MICFILIKVEYILGMNKKIPLAFVLLLTVTGLYTQAVQIPDSIRTLTGYRDPFIMGLFLGIFLFIAAYNLFLFLSLKDISYLYHMLFLISLTGILFTLEGYAYRYFLYPFPVKINLIIMFMVQVMAFIWGTQFSRALLDTKKRIPLLDKALLILIGVDILAAVVITISVFLDLILVARISIPILGALHTIFLFISLIIVLRQGYKPANFYLLGWIILALGVWAQVSREYFPVLDNIVTQYGMYWGTLIDVICFSHALTKHINQLQEEHEKQKQKLVQADKLVSLGTMASGIAHEIANPTNAITSNAAFLKESYNYFLVDLDDYYGGGKGRLIGTLPYNQAKQKVQEGLDGIIRSADRISHIISTMRNFYTRLKPELQESVDLNRMIRSAVALSKTELDKANIHLKLECEQALPPVKGSFQQLEQVIVNLLLNAIQAITENKERQQHKVSGDKKEIKIFTTYIEKKKIIKIIIQDSGMGMDQETLKHIQEPFYSTRIEKGGSGLGLYISGKIINDHGARIEFSSTYGKGTQVTISLPVNPKVSP